MHPSTIVGEGRRLRAVRQTSTSWLVAIWFGLMGLSVIVLALLAYRMTIGVDLSDESCYATFLDGWLKDGLGHSENLVVHQSAGLLLLPAARLYTWFAGSERGLMLFLRFIF